MTSHVTNYVERDAARAVYLAWLSRAEHALRERPTPPVGLAQDKPTTAFMRKRLLEQI